MRRVCCPIPETGAAPGTLGPEARTVYRGIELYTAERGIAPPILISSCRSPLQQLELQERWDRGDRAGLAARPAAPETSRHVPDQFGICHAFDLGNDSNWLSVVGHWVSETYKDARWGGYFFPADINHFDVTSRVKWISPASVRVG